MKIDNKPKLSIILPVYNRESSIKKCIISILNQNFKNFELIIINDGSTDNTENIIKKIKDKRIVYIYQTNHGEYNATNRGLRTAKGKYITFVHSDDYLLPKSLSSRIEALEKNKNIDLVHGDIIKEDRINRTKKILKGVQDSGKKIFNYYVNHGEDERTKNGYYVHHLTFMFKKELLKKTGYFYEAPRYGGDLDFMLRLLKIAEVKYISKPLYVYIRHSKTVSVELKKKLNEKQITENILKKYQ